MDCNTARLLINFASPCRTELEGSEAEDLESHLAECPHCGAVAQAERRVDNRIGQAVRAVPVPDGLRNRLLARLDEEREAWYRRRVRRGLGVLAAAATVLLAIWIGITLHKSQRPTPDPVAAADEFLVDLINPTPAQVEERFKTAAPPEADWNYRQLRYSTMAEFEGKRVPMLLFTNKDDQARVYILSDKDFDLSKLDPGPVAVGSGCKAEVRLAPRPGYAYIIVYTGESLEPFRPRRP